MILKTSFATMCGEFLIIELFVNESYCGWKHLLNNKRVGTGINIDWNWYVLENLVCGIIEKHHYTSQGHEPSDELDIAPIAPSLKSLWISVVLVHFCLSYISEAIDFRRLLALMRRFKGHLCEGDKGHLCSIGMSLWALTVTDFYLSIFISEQTKSYHFKGLL